MQPTCIEHISKLNPDQIGPVCLLYYNKAIVVRKPGIVELFRCQIFPPWSESDLSKRHGSLLGLVRKTAWKTVWLGNIITHSANGP